MDVYLKAIVTFSAIILIASCTSNTNLPVAANDSVATDAITTTSSSSVAVNTDSIPNTIPLVIDSSVYVGVVDAFDSTGEFYISIFSLPHRESENYFEVLPGKTDSVIYEDIESQRNRIPMNIAREYFNLSGLERISVYNNVAYSDKRMMPLSRNVILRDSWVLCFRY